MNILSSISGFFRDIHIVYFDSHLSRKLENKKLINNKNIIQYIIANEFNMPNDAAFHRQVLFLAKNRIYDQEICSKSLPPRVQSHKILKLNKTPNAKIYRFSDDFELLNYFSNKPENFTFLFTSKLYYSKMDLLYWNQ